MSLRDTLQQTSEAAEVSETAAYFDSGADQIYCVTHAARGQRRAGVLIAPPFGRERLNSYVSVVNWARRLASSGFDVLRFDYRGTGESTGRFEETDLDCWREDIECMATLLRGRLDGQPLVLHGVRLGALLASTAFNRGCGDALLLWDPPKTAKKMLLEVLRGKLLEDMALGITGERKTRDAYVQDLEAGELVEVDGHPWSRRLWRSAADVTLELPDDSESRPCQCVMPVRNPKMRSTERGQTWQVPVPMPPFWREGHLLVPDISDLFECCLGWLLETTQEGESR